VFAFKRKAQLQLITTEDHRVHRDQILRCVINAKSNSLFILTQMKNFIAKDKETKKTPATSGLGTDKTTDGAGARPAPGLRPRPASTKKKEKVTVYQFSCSRRMTSNRWQSFPVFRMPLHLLHLLSLLTSKRETPICLNVQYHVFKYLLFQGTNSLPEIKTPETANRVCIPKNKVQL